MSEVLVAGATGAVGSALLPMLRARGFSVTPHVRPKTAERHPLGKDPAALICDLDDAARLDAAVARADAIVCSVGTMRRRFAAGDTYESSDVRPVALLIESARRLGRRPYFVLVSALGARRGGGYLGYKFKAEEVVRESGLPQAILRPSVLDSRNAGSQPSDGEPRKPPPLFGAITRAIGFVPGLRGLSEDIRPIRVETVCAAIATLLGEQPATTAPLRGRDLFRLAAR